MGDHEATLPWASSTTHKVPIGSSDSSSHIAGVQSSVGPTTSTGKMAERNAQVVADMEQAYIEAFHHDHTITEEDVAHNPDMGELSLLSSNGRWRRAKSELQMVILCGFSRGHKRHTPRLQQATEVWNQNIAPLFTDTSGKTKETFTNWFANIEASRRVYFEAASLGDQKRDIPNLLSLHVDEAVKNSSGLTWLEDDDLVKDANKKLVKWLDRFARRNLNVPEQLNRADIEWYKLMLDQTPKLATEFGHFITNKAQGIAYDAQTNLNGSEVGVKPNDKSFVLYFQWRDAAGNDHELDEFYVPPELMPTHVDDLRYIYFVPEGIDIKNKQGVPLSVASTGKLVSLPLENILLLTQDKTYKRPFLQLWEEQTGLGVHGQLMRLASLGDRQVDMSPEMASESILPPSYFQGRQEPLRPIYIRKEHARGSIQDLLPLQTGDGAWLLYQFFRQYYPQGGEVYCGNPIHYKEVDSVWKQLDQFCQRPRYRNHPHITFLHAMISVTYQMGTASRKIVTYLIAVVEIFRRNVTQRKDSSAQVQNPRGSERPESTILTISAEEGLGLVEEHS